MRRYEKLGVAWFDAALYEVDEWRNAFPDHEKIRCLDLVVMLAENKKRKLEKRVSPTYKHYEYAAQSDSRTNSSSPQSDSRTNSSSHEDNDLSAFFESVAASEATRSIKDPQNKPMFPKNMQPHFYSFLDAIEKKEPKRRKNKYQKREQNPNLLNSVGLQNVIIEENKIRGNPLRMIPSLQWLRNFASNIVGTSKQKRDASLENYEIGKEIQSNFNNMFVPGESLVVEMPHYHNKFLWNKKCVDGLLRLFFAKNEHNGETFAFGFDQKKAEAMSRKKKAEAMSRNSNAQRKKIEQT